MGLRCSMINDGGTVAGLLLSLLISWANLLQVRCSVLVGSLSTQPNHFRLLIVSYFLLVSIGIAMAHAPEYVEFLDIALITVLVGFFCKSMIECYIELEVKFHTFKFYLRWLLEAILLSTMYIRHLAIPVGCFKCFSAGVSLYMTLFYRMEGLSFFCRC